MSKIRHKKLLCTVGLTATFAFAGAAADDATDVPFVAALSGTAQWDGGPIATCQGAGVASHLGLTTSQCTAELDLTGYAEYSVCSGEDETGLGIPNINTMVLTAADGDQLVLVSHDIACEVVPYRSFHGIGQWAVESASSTGRFANASGTGDFDGNVDFVAGDVRVSLLGEIDY